MRKKLDTKDEDSFIQRWSKKKNQLEDPLVPLEQPEEERGEKTTEKVEEKEIEVNDTVLTDEDMPAVESLDVDSDFSGFLSPGVSDELRRVALRKLFRSAKFNVRDGLDDYDDDFRSFAALGDIITSDMKHQMELAEEREKQLQEEQDQLEQVAQTSDKEQSETIEEELSEELDETSDPADEQLEDLESKA